MISRILEMSGWLARSRRSPALEVAIGHFLAFATCRSFARDERLAPEEIVAVAVAAVRGVLARATAEQD